MELLVKEKVQNYLIVPQKIVFGDLGQDLALVSTDPSAENVAKSKKKNMEENVKERVLINANAKFISCSFTTNKDVIHVISFDLQTLY